MPRSKPIQSDEEVRRNPDAKIDQDFTGYPAAPSQKKQINPKTGADKKTAGVEKKRSKKTYGS